MPDSPDHRVAVLGCMRGLGNIDNAGCASVDHGQRSQEHAGIGVGRLIDRREHRLDVAIVIGVEQTIGQDTAQQALVGMIMRVDECR